MFFKLAKLAISILKMIKNNVFWIFVLLQSSNGAELTLECITRDQLKVATEILCKHQRDNQTLWNSVIECHRPMTDEVKCYFFLKL